MENVSPYNFKNVFSARLKTDDVDLLNENIESFIPDDLPENIAVSGRDIIMEMAKRALAKNVSKKELIDLKNENFEFKNNKSLQIDALEREIKVQQGFVNENRIAFQNLSEENDRLQAENDNLRSNLTATTAQLVKPNELVLKLSKGEKVVVEAFRSKFAEKLGKAVSSEQMIFDLFWKYITKQETEIAFPFLFTPAQIKEMIIKSKTEQ